MNILDAIILFSLSLWNHSRQLHHLGFCSHFIGRMKHLWTFGHTHTHQLSARNLYSCPSSRTVNWEPLYPGLHNHSSAWTGWFAVTMQSGPTFHLHWQPEEHNSAPRGAKKVLQPDSAIQSDNWVVNPKESLAAFGLNYLLPEFWTTRRRHETFICGALKSKRHAWNPGECCLWLWWQWGIWWRGKKF